MSATLQTAKVIEGFPTDIVVQYFADRIMVLVTQLGKVGSLVRAAATVDNVSYPYQPTCQIEATIPEATPLLPPPAPPSDSTSEIPLPHPSTAINLKPLLGVAPSGHLQTLYSLYAAQVATLVWMSGADGSIGDNRRAVILGIALKSMGGAESGGSVSEQERQVFLGVMRTIRDLLAGK